MALRDGEARINTRITPTTPKLGDSPAVRFLVFRSAKKFATGKGLVTECGNSQTFEFAQAVVGQSVSELDSLATMQSGVAPKSASLN